MKVRSKLLILLLAVALVPLVVGTTWQQMSMRRLGDRLAASTRGALIEIAFRNLHLLVDDYARFVNRDKKMVELAVRLQVREVERRLAQPPPSGRRPFLSRHYDRGDRLPSGMAESKMHLRTAKNGERKTIAVTYDEQVYFVVKGVWRSSDISCLTGRRRSRTSRSPGTASIATRPGATTTASLISSTEDDITLVVIKVL